MMKFLLLLITLLAVVMLAACERPTSEEQNQGMQPVNRNTSAQAEAPPPPDAPQPGSEAPPGPPPAQPTTMKMPSFWNTTTGEIQDLPSFPGGARMNVQYGPINGIETGFIVLSTNQPIETIAAFYDKAIKSNGWSVVNKLTDPEMYKVSLKKDAFNEAVIQVDKDPQTGIRRIGLTRLQKPKQPAGQPAEPPKPPNP